MFHLRLKLHGPALLACLLAAGTPFTSAQLSAQTNPGNQPAGLSNPASTNLVELPIPLLPSRFGEWQAKAAPVTGTDPSQADATEISPLKEAGFDRFATATYAPPSGTATLEVTALQFGDATGAYSAYTLLRKPGMHPTASRLGTESVTAGDEVLLWAGTTVVRVTGSAIRGGGLHDLQSLASALPKIGGRRGLAPLLPTLLPAKGLEPATIRYALGPQSYAAQFAGRSGVLQPSTIIFSKSTEAATADYATRTGKGTLTLLLCPTPQIAGDQGRAIEAQMKSGLPAGSAPGSVRLRRIGPLVAMTSGAFSPAEADTLIRDVRLTTDLTWNKQMPLEFHTEVRKTASLLVSIAVLSGVMMLAAVVLGLFFGGGRAAIRLLQGKPAYSEPEFLRIDLRGPPHAILRPDSGPSSDQPA